MLEIAEGRIDAQAFFKRELETIAAAEADDLRRFEDDLFKAKLSDAINDFAQKLYDFLVAVREGKA